MWQRLLVLSSVRVGFYAKTLRYRVCVCVIREKNISYCIWMQSSISQRSQQSVVLLVTVQMLWKWDSILFNLPIGNISFGCHLHAWKKKTDLAKYVVNTSTSTPILCFFDVYLCAFYLHTLKNVRPVQQKAGTREENDHKRKRQRWMESGEEKSERTMVLVFKWLRNAYMRKKDGKACMKWRWYSHLMRKRIRQTKHSRFSMWKRCKRRREREREKARNSHFSLCFGNALSVVLFALQFL